VFYWYSTWTLIVHTKIIMKKSMIYMIISDNIEDYIENVLVEISIRVYY
jgi:hypothetical protein